MQQSEILSLVERLIPVYGSPDFEDVLDQLTVDAAPSAKVLAKMELNRIMTPCIKTIDLRGKVQGECREYELDGKTHWLDDAALNSYHKKVKRYGGYTEGVWEALANRRTKNRVTHQQSQQGSSTNAGGSGTPFKVEPIHLGFSLQRQEKRLKIATKVNITPSNGEEITAVSSNLSPSGLKLKVPTAFEFSLGDTFKALFTELREKTNVPELTTPIDYRIIGIDESADNDSVHWIRAIRLTETDAIQKAIDVALDSFSKKANHKNQDKLAKARAHCYESTYIRHTTALPLFFNKTELKYALLNENNLDTWNYWHDERNQQSLTSLFSQERMADLTKPGIKSSNNVIYAFTHEHQEKYFYYSMMLPESTREERQLFWHVGARKKSWKVFQLHMFELSPEEIASVINSTPEYEESKLEFTHMAVLQEIAGDESRKDYLLTEKPSIKPSQLNRFRHPRQSKAAPKGIYFDAVSRRKEPRYSFKSPVTLKLNEALSVKGITVNFSSQGLSIRLTKPLQSTCGSTLPLTFDELQLYDAQVPLTNVPYKLVRISPNGLDLQLKLENTNATNKTVLFLKKLISHNKNKLPVMPEQIPGVDLLDSMYDIILPRLVSTPIYVAKHKKNLQPASIGLNYPVPPHLKILTMPGQENSFSLDSIFKSRTNRLLKVPLRPITNPKPVYSEIYFAVAQNSMGQITATYTKLDSEFESLKERIHFVKKAKQKGSFYAFRLFGIPVATDKTEMLTQKLTELATAGALHTRALTKELKSLMGYCELINISEEVLIRLELT